MVKENLRRLSKIILIMTLIFTMLCGTGANVVLAATSSTNVIKMLVNGKYESVTTAEIQKDKYQMFCLYKNNTQLKASNWTIGSTQVATISNNGGVVIVKGIKEGATYLKCQYAGKEYMITIKVINNENTTYKISPSSTSIKVADTRTFELKENNNTVMCTWQVSNPEILKLEITKGKAKVTGLKAGTCTLKAYRKW